MITNCTNNFDFINLADVIVSYKCSPLYVTRNLALLKQHTERVIFIGEHIRTHDLTATRPPVLETKLNSYLNGQVVGDQLCLVRVPAQCDSPVMMPPYRAFAYSNDL